MRAPINRSVPIVFLVLLAASVLAPANAAQVNIDGVVDEPAWGEARRFERFFVTEPFTRGAPRHPTEVRLLGTPDGIAVAFICTHPPSTPRQRAITPRDADMPGDRVNVYLDFDGDARIAYNFTLGLSGAQQDGTLTNENVYVTDWDGEWLSAVAESETAWTAEVLIPWTIASFKGTGAPTRNLNVLFDRVIGATRERSATQPITFNSPRYISLFERVEIAQYRKPLLDFYPYTSVESDHVHDHVSGRVGADLLWKPSGRFQLIAAVNPDFGQVEADELVVNFDAIEAFFTDKRPFFTENQGMFDLRTPDEGVLIYTRRIGGARDDDPTRIAEIDGAVKLTGSAGRADYGVLAVLERDYSDDLNSAFYAQRAVVPWGRAQIGYLGTLADRPFFDRTAQVHALDAVWRPNASWLVTGQLLGSFIDEQGGSRDGDGIWARAFHPTQSGWEHELELTHFGQALDFNDMGFQERASLNQARYELTRRLSGFADDDPRGGVAWTGIAQLSWNDRGENLPHGFAIQRTAQQKSGAVLESLLEAFSRGVDDLISRGHGNVRQDARLTSALQSYQSARFGRFRYFAAVEVGQEGNDDYALRLETNLQFYARENLTFDVYPRAALEPRLAHLAARRSARELHQARDRCEPRRGLVPGPRSRATHEAAVARDRCARSDAVSDRPRRGAHREPRYGGALHGQQPRRAAALPLDFRAAVRPLCGLQPRRPRADGGWGGRALGDADVPRCARAARCGSVSSESAVPVLTRVKRREDPKGTDLICPL